MLPCAVVYSPSVTSRRQVKTRNQFFSSSPTVGVEVIFLKSMEVRGEGERKKKISQIINSTQSVSLLLMSGSKSARAVVWGHCQVGGGKAWGRVVYIFKSVK